MHSKDSKSLEPISSKAPSSKGKPESIKDLLFEIEARPAMYLGRNSLVCLRSFLDGWCARGAGLGVKGEEGALDRFQLWVESRFRMENTTSWDRIIICFSQDDADALRRFFDLFHEFVEEEQGERR